MPARDVLRQRGLDAGLGAVGFTHTAPLREARIALQTRRAHGRHADMQFTYRNPERSTTPKRIMATAQSLIVGAWPYAADVADRSGSPPDDATPRSGPEGAIAAYAWRDHYEALRCALEVVAAPLIDAGWRTRIVADDNALVDRAAAIRAGVGWAGKNSNVLVPGQGSWFVLGAVVTDAPIEPDAPIDDGCGSCRRCLDGCPTGAIVADGVVDARRCLAWLLQAREFPVEFREALGTRIYGCDDCQTVCPPSRANATGLVGDETSSLPLLDLLVADDDALLDHVHRWYIPGRELRFVRRNALIALGNSPIASDELDRTRSVLDRFDPPATDAADPVATDAMLQEHAQWARRRLGL